MVSTDTLAAFIVSRFVDATRPNDRVRLLSILFHYVPLDTEQASPETITYNDSQFFAVLSNILEESPYAAPRRMLASNELRVGDVVAHRASAEEGVIIGKSTTDLEGWVVSYGFDRTDPSVSALVLDVLDRRGE